MKKNLPVTGIEEGYSDNTNILSTTCPKGIIRYVNKDFIKVSGFSEQELLNQNHNIVRHPDMPAAAFDNLWQDLKQQRAWMGVVKNRCKNGNHYWVDAYVSPIIRDGQVVEYQSVRRKPSRELVERAEQLYNRLNTGRKPRMLNDRLGLTGRLMLGWLLLIGSVLAIGGLSGVFSLDQLVPLLALLPAGALLSHWLMRPYRQTVARARRISDNPVARYVYTGRNDDLGWLQLALRKLESEAVGIVGRLSDASLQLLSDTRLMAEEAGHTSQEVERQFTETERVAGVITEMSASVQQVAENAGESVDAVRAANERAASGITLVEETVERLHRLCSQILESAGAVRQLAGEAERISAIVHTIADIADKTNLLALNAAIEAARAGEQGRGFAVVADEVRDLAVRTRDATQEIETMVADLQRRSQNTVTTMEQGADYAQSTVEQATEANRSLSEITAAMVALLEMNSQVASAVEQQSGAAEGINHSVHAIRDAAEETLQSTCRNEQATGSINRMVAELESLVQQYWQQKRQH
ncbi:methyl-accepting chemotaxis protein [Marinobacterium arenosum]|uniref:methyl-accepting chemotaxis protein n=1 Tax=Marinobacterium arenosum TaxID=2862496 RepID=UPI001C97A60A|nr:PAS domain-containing methyl-accepting chemotaxis protein [Marinobacterium arenosum]MBY4679010.1 methyl-accepting chemotaxis protein [Marinobacterium arenosum]